MKRELAKYIIDRMEVWLDKRLLVLLIILLLIPGLFLWYRHTRQLRLVGSYSSDNSIIAISHDGFVIRDSPDRLSFRDWAGHRRWLIRIPKRNFSGWKSPTNNDLAYLDVYEGCVFSISYHGNWLATATAQGEFIKFQIWQQGALVGEHRLPSPPHPTQTGEQQMVSLQALSDGQVLLWAPQNPQYPIYLFNGNQRLATTVPAAINSLQSKNWQYYFFSRDGKALIAYNRDFSTFVYQISWVKKYLRIKLIASAPAPGDLYGKNTILTAYGSCYRGSKQLTAINGWLMAQPPLDGWFTAQIKPEYLGAFKGKIRIFDPLTNKKWILREKSDALSATVTASGKFAAIMYEPNSKKTAIAIIEKPDRYRTRGYLPARRDANNQYFASKMFLSPDGHYLLIAPEGNGDSFLLYHWK